ncbi:mucin-12-like isoform X2 [Penaeus japonicus]|uniref:mucin-12-like isoform X2 n=1 Tax=Penaeus japonicus TaxID=27405 RepID=UPI001C71742F|nr:mucin-12-like isoform X2 [Penaeus japonicus]
MPSLLACFVCGGKGESDDVRVLDYRHSALHDVPADVFASERTLEELLLDSNQLTELPRQLFYCHGLRELGLSDNELTSLPPAVASLINLTSIDLSKNAISDIPDNIKGCKQLAVVDASINPLCRLPEGFTQLLSLQELYLNDTFLEYLPANFGRLSKLKILELRENQLNTLPKSIARLTNLQRLDIGQNDFSELPEVIGSLGNLTELLFDNNKVKSLPPMMGKLKKLLHVDASKNKIDWVSGELENCVVLTDLHLSSNNLKELPESLGGCSQLQLLRLDDNALTHLPESLGGLAALEELVVTQNDLETLPASIGLLRALHTLHVDDNLLTELPPEIGSCIQLTVLTAASNRLTSVPAELGHLPKLAVLNLCDNLIPHLPVSLTKLKLRALWLSENQNKPQVQLQSDTLPETGQRVLTCFMLPQQVRSHQPEMVVETDTFPGQGWDEQRRAKTLIKFAFDGDVDKPGRLTRAPTPYPKELKALAKHARNLHSLQKDPSRQFVLGRSEDAGRASSPTQPAKEDSDAASGRRDSDSALKQPLIERTAKSGAPLDDSGDAEDASIPLTVVEPQVDERPQLREARNVRKSSNPDASSSVSIAPKSLNSNGTSSSGADLPYTIGDRKLFGHAQVIAMKAPGDTSAATKNTTSSAEENGTPQHPAVSSEGSGPVEGEQGGDTPDKRIKKPPPYHIAAVMSRHAADFQEASVEVSSSQGTNAQGGAGLTVKDLPGSQQALAVTSPTTAIGEDENNDTSSSSDSGYGNGKSSSQQTAEEQQCSDSCSNSPSSPQNLTDSSITMPSTPTSPLGSAGSAAPSSKSFVVATSTRPPSAHLSPITTTGSLPSDRHSYAAPQNSSSPLVQASMGQHIYSSGHLSYSQKMQTSTTMTNARPASIAAGQQLENQSSGSVQRPGSLALGTLADSALLNRLPRDHRPGSLAAPINTVGIPPAPTRAMSHMGLNVSSPTRARDPTMFRSQDLSRAGRGLSLAEDRFSGSASARQESNGLVSIIDQVTSSLLEHGDSPPPKTPVTPSAPSSTFPTTSPTTATPSSQYPASKLAGTQVTADRIPLSASDSTTTSESYVTSDTSGRSSLSYHRGAGSSLTSSGGLTNFTQDQPRGEVLHPTPHRPHVISPSGSRHGLDSLQDSSVGTPDKLGRPHEAMGVPQHIETGTSPPRTAPKPQSRIPALSPESYPGKVNHKTSFDSHASHSPAQMTESRIPSLGSVGRSPSNFTSERASESHTLPESRIPTLGAMGRSPSSLNNENKAESRIPTLNNMGHSSSNLLPDKQTPGESRIPTLGSTGRSQSNLGHETPTTPDSRIPTLGAVGRTSSNLTRESVGLKKPANSHEGITKPATNLHTPQQQRTVGMNGSGIPSLGSQGRSNSSIGSGIPSPSPASTGLRTGIPKHDATDGLTKKSLGYGGTSQVSSTSRLQSPSYSSGIRPPTYSSASPLPSPTQHPSGNFAQSPSYSSGIRPPSVNSAINTPGIPLPSSGSSSHLTNPGSRGSITSTGSGTRIPMVAGGSTSRLPAPSANKHRVSPSAQNADNKTNNSAWMFGQHKNARVFPVVIEKNPGLGFTIGLSDADAEDKSIYVMSVAGGGAASSALKVGDKLLQVDGVDLRLADLHTATSILNKTSNTVNLMVSRLQ